MKTTELYFLCGTVYYTVHGGSKFWVGKGSSKM